MLHRQERKSVHRGKPETIVHTYKTGKGEVLIFSSSTGYFLKWQGNEQIKYFHILPTLVIPKFIYFLPKPSNSIKG